MHHIDTITKKEAELLGIINSEGLGFVKPQTAFKNITEQLLAELKKENLVWRKGWRSGVIIKGKTYGAQNYETQRPYTGGNAFFINMQNLLNGTNYNFFLTPKQIAARGGTIKKGAKPFPVSVFIKNIKTTTVVRDGVNTDVNTEERGIIWYHVFPIDLVENLKPIIRKTLKPDTFNEIIVAEADKIIELMPQAPPIKHGGDRAYYAPAPDYVQMPHKKAFGVQQEYYSVLFHELIHSTGNKKRLDRDLTGKFGDKSYAGEELIAEIGAAFLCGACEIEYFTVNNSAAYLKGWSKTVAKEIEADPNFLKRSVFKAARAANFIIGKTLEKHGEVKNTSVQKKEVVKPKEKHYAGKEITPNKTVKASVNKAIEDLMSIDKKLKNIGAMALGMLFSCYKNDNFPDTNEGLKGKLFEKMEQQGIVEYMTRYELTEYGMEIVKKIEARLTTLKAKKSGTDLFPELSGVTDAVLIFINAFLSLHNKTVSKEELIFILTNFQTAIKGGLIKAKHPLSVIANTTQDKLVRLINSLSPNEKIKLVIADKNKITDKIESLHGLGFWNVIASAVIGKTVEHFAHKHLTKDEKPTLNGVNKTILYKNGIIQLNPYFNGRAFGFTIFDSKTDEYLLATKGHVGTREQALASAKKHIDSNLHKKINNQPQVLSGVMSVTDAINGKYDLIGLDGNYLKLIGEACKPTSFFIYGPGGSGKSTFTILFANYMAKKGNKMLYVAGEQFATPVFSKMLQRLKIEDSSNFVIVKSLDTISLKGFDFVVIDSKDSLNFELNDFIALKKNNPTLSFVVLSQATKDGGFTGSEKWRNEVDTLLYCENMRVHSNMDKNRWGGSADFLILKMV